MHSIHGSNTKKELKDMWRTPKPVFDYLNMIYNFNLDAYANAEDTLCPNFIGKDDNAHVVNWSEYTDGDPVVAFCNPPYSQPNIKLCLVAARREARRGATAVVVIPNQPAQYWKGLVINQANLMIATLGRLSFIDPESGDPIQGNPGGTMILEYRPRSARTRIVATSTHYISLDEIMGGIACLSRAHLTPAMEC